MSMRLLPWLILISLGMVTYGIEHSSGAVVPDGIPPCSGMAVWNTSEYLVTHDLKLGEAGARFGLISPLNHLSYRPLNCQWSGNEGNDIESLSPLEGEPGQFLACESGYVQGQFGHIYWLSAIAGDQPSLKVQQHYALPTKLQQEIEGMVTLKLNGVHRWLVVLGGRGGRWEEPARLYWGILDRDHNSLEWTAEGLKGTEITLPRRLGPFARTLSDMYLDQQHQLFISSCTTPGKQGPNRSLIFKAGNLSNNLQAPLHHTNENQDIWWIDGCKIEGICPCNRPGYGPAYITDDDDLGGVWRAVPLSPSWSY